MPFSEYQLKRHLEIQNKKEVEQNNGEAVKLVAVVETQEEADALNVQIMN